MFYTQEKWLKNNQIDYFTNFSAYIIANRRGMKKKNIAQKIIS